MKWHILCQEQPEDEKPILIRCMVPFDCAHSYLYKDSVLNLRGSSVAIKFQDKLILNSIIQYLVSSIQMYDIEEFPKDTVWTYIGD
jgi:hypothetical protein